MFSSFSGNLSGMTGWIQENSKKAADSIQKSVTDISQGVSDMMVETPQDPTGKQIHFYHTFNLAQLQRNRIRPKRDLVKLLSNPLRQKINKTQDNPNRKSRQSTKMKF
jgi:hypothetical protein